MRDDRRKPGPVGRPPCVMSPYHYRLDWQIWFAAMSSLERNPWLIHLVAKLLVADSNALGLFAADPFAGARPSYIRASFYRYRFAPQNDKTAAWWVRERVGLYFPPVALDDPALQRYLQARQWLERLE